MNVATWAAVAAVIADSIVTIIVGYRLTKVAKRETTKAADNLKPVLQKELANAALLLIPIVVTQIKEHLGEKKEDATIRAIQPTGDKSDAINDRMGSTGTATNRNRPTKQ